MSAPVTRVERIGNHCPGFADEEPRALGFTLDDLRGWKPAARRRRRTG